LRALDAVGVRLAQVFLVTVLPGAHSRLAAPRRPGINYRPLHGAGAAGVAYVLLLRRGRAWLAALVVLTGSPWRCYPPRRRLSARIRR